MPLFNCYINDEDRKDLINYIIAKGSKVIPDQLYKEDRYTIISDSVEFFKNLENESVRFFIVDDSFEIEPLILSKNKYLEEPRYSVYQRKGGPYVDTAFYLGYADDAILRYKCSTIDHYARFIHYNSSKEFDATEALKAYYNDLVKYVKSKCKLVKKKGKSLWVSRQVLLDNPHLLD